MLDNHSIFVSRHVKFYEHIFPYHFTSSVPESQIIPSTHTTSVNSYTFLNWLSHNSTLTPAPDIPSHTSVIPSSSSSFFHDFVDTTSSIQNSVVPFSPVTTYVSSTSSIHSLRHSTRIKSRPTWWKDYHTLLAPDKHTAHHSHSVFTTRTPTDTDPFSLHSLHHI